MSFLSAGADLGTCAFYWVERGVQERSVKAVGGV
jgi:hypothetical protein